MNSMQTLPAIENYKITALLKEDELRLFEEVPSIRLRIARDRAGQWKLYSGNTDIVVSPTQFQSWIPEWNI